MRNALQIFGNYFKNMRNAFQIFSIVIENRRNHILKLINYLHIPKDQFHSSQSEAQVLKKGFPIDYAYLFLNLKNSCFDLMRTAVLMLCGGVCCEFIRSKSTNILKNLYLLIIDYSY